MFPPPSKKLIEGVLAKESARIPLVLEIILGLRRTTGDYERAIQAYRQEGGDPTRSYLFDREYNRLGSENSKYLLAALSLFSEAIDFDSVRRTLRIDENNLRDCIGEVLEMFVNTEEEIKSESTLYGLKPLAKVYITQQSRGLDRYQTILARVKELRSPIKARNPELELLKLDVNKLLVNKVPERAEEALSKLTSSKLTPKTTQAAEYSALLGRTHSILKQPEKAVEQYKIMADMKFADAQAMRDWYWIEYYSGSGLENAAGICESVRKGKSYSNFDKMDFTNKLAWALKKQAENNIPLDQEKGVAQYKAALIMRLDAYGLAIQLQTVDVAKVYGPALNDARNLLTVLSRMNRSNQLFDVIEQIRTKHSDLPIDPWATAVVQFLPSLARNKNPASLNASEGLSRRLLTNIKPSSSKLRFADRAVTEALRVALKETLEDLKIAKARLLSST